MTDYESQLIQFLRENDYFMNTRIIPDGFTSRRILLLQVTFDFLRTHQFPNLAEGLRENTTYALKMIQKHIAKRLVRGPHVFICLRTKDLPLLDSTQVRGNRDLMFKTTDPNSKALVKAVNIQIVSMCEESNFVIGSIFKCNMEGCGKERIFNHFIFGLSEPIFACYEHRNSNHTSMREEINERICTYRKKVHLKSFTTAPSSTTFRASFFHILNPRMYELAKLGARIKYIEGIAVCWETMSGVREVGIDVLNCEFENPFQMVREPYGTGDYSEEIILRLRSENIENSPISLVFAFAEYFAIDILGKGNLMLKMCLLVSLIALRNKREEENEYIRHKSIMVVGNYLYRVKTLLAFASKFAHNHFIHSSQVPVSVVTRKNRETFWNDAGSLQLATNGVCVIDAQTVSDKDHNDIVSILEHNKFPIKLDKNQSSKEETLHIALWVSQSLKVCQQTSKIKPIPLSLFPLVIQCEESPTSRGDSPLASKDWAHLFTLTSRTKVTFTEEAKDILENYFSTARRQLRDKCDRQAISHLLISAASLAKLSLRPNVLSFDAVLAISLFEESCLIKYGTSVLCGTDFPRFNCLVQLFQDSNGHRHIEKICESLVKNLDPSFANSGISEE